MQKGFTVLELLLGVLLIIVSVSGMSLENKYTQLKRNLASCRSEASGLIQTIDAYRNTQNGGGS